jgi:hypothetical protein
VQEAKIIAATAASKKNLFIVIKYLINKKKKINALFVVTVTRIANPRQWGNKKSV